MSDQDRFEDAGQQRQHLEDIVRVSRSCGTGTPNSIQWALDEIDALRDSLTALVVAAGRMRDGWAEGDADVKNHLWRTLHATADEADDRHGIYPL